MRASGFGVLSLALHGLLLLLVASPATQHALAARRPPALAPEDVGVAWAGNTLDVELVLAAAAEEAGRGETLPQEARQATPSIEALPAAPTTPAPPRAPGRQDKILDQHHGEPTPPLKLATPKSPAAATVAPRAADPLAEAPPKPRGPAKPAAPAPRTARLASPQAAHSGAASSDGDGHARGGQFGAEGKSAARDLGHAFARAIGPANQADAAWSKLPVGPFATIDIAIDVDEAGKVGEVIPVSASPNAQMLSLARRTVILLRGGVFHLRGAEAMAGRAVLRLRAEVSDLDASGANVQGGTIDLAFVYANGKGKAAFTREGGRHVEIFVTSLRTEPGVARPL